MRDCVVMKILSILSVVVVVTQGYDPSVLINILYLNAFD